MIVYDNLWKTIEEKGLSQYKLIKDHHVSAGQLSRLRANAPVSSHTIDTLCRILDCSVSDIMTYIKDPE